LQRYRFKQLLKQCKKASFYQKLLHEKNTISDFPVINKSIFMANFNSINTVGIQLDKAMKVAIQAEETRDFSPTIKGITIGLSSGTSGNRGIFMANEMERAKWVAYMLDRVLGFSLKRRTVAFFLRANSNLYSSVNSKLISFHFFDLLNPLEQHIEHLNTLQPTILVAQPSMLMELAKAIEERKLCITPAKIISVAEVLTPEDNRYLSTVFQQIIHQVYQCTEGFLASTCKNGTLHFNEDFLMIEKRYLDEEKRRFQPIITDLSRKTQLVIRYELNDIIRTKESCSCGNSWLAIEAIEGRSDDMLVFNSSNGEEVKIFPDFFRRAIILSDPKIVDYALIEKSKNQLDLYVASNQLESFEAASKEILKILDRYDVHDVRIIQTGNNGYIPGNKLRRIRNDSRKVN